MVWLQENWIAALVVAIVAVAILWWLFARRQPEEIAPPAAEPPPPAKPLEPVRPEIVAAEPAFRKAPPVAAEPAAVPPPAPPPAPEPEPVPAADIPEEPTVPPEPVAEPGQPEPAADTPAEPPATPAAANNLQLLKGVGPKLATLLNGLGVISFQQIADWTEADIAAIDPQLGAFQGRIARDNLVDQAAYLARGDKAGF
ncbi:MAG TPA: hypothetical protein PKD99_11080, partial [Sphingopyxis sp.]|nr:hypothetical protein [Sphingopyxis sp.]